MKYVYALFYALITLPFLTSAQDIAANNATSTTYSSSTNTLAGSHPSQAAANTTWASEEDQVSGHISHTTLQKMKARTDFILTYLHDSCLSEVSATPLCHAAFSSDKSGSNPLFKYSVQCDFEKAHLTVMVNDMSALLDQLVVNNQPYQLLTPPSPTAGKQGDQSVRTWLITNDDRMPYTVISRKEYLLEAKAELTALKNNLLEQMKEKFSVRPSDIQQAEKKAAIDQLNAEYSGADLQARLKMFENDYRSDEQYLKENSDNATAALDSTLLLMDHLLTHLCAETLSKPAFVSGSAADFQGFEDGTPGCKMLVKMNPAYFNPYLGAEKPQLILITWSFDPEDSASLGIDKLLVEHFDIDTWKSILGK